MCRNYNSSYKGYPPNNPNNSTRSNCLSAPPDAVPFVPIPIVYDNCIYVEVYLLLDAYGMNSNGSGPYPDTMPPVPVYPQRSPPVFIAHPDYPPRMPSAHAYPVYPSDDYEPHPSYYPPRRLQIESVPPLSVMDTRNPVIVVIRSPILLRILQDRVTHNVLIRITDGNQIAEPVIDLLLMVVILLMPLLSLIMKIAFLI